MEEINDFISSLICCVIKKVLTENSLRILPIVACLSEIPF